jgi:proliferating cell nuclear antigen
MPNKADCAVFLKSIQGGAIRTLFEVLKEVLHDVLLKFDETGVSLVQMDSTKNILVSMKLRAEDFEEYFCVGTSEVGLNLMSLFKLLKITGSHDTVSMYLLRNQDDELGITIHNPDKNSVTEFMLNLLIVPKDAIVIPDTEFDSVLTMPSVYFQRLCRDADNIADSVVIKTEGNTLSLSCRGDFARQATVIGQTEEGMAISTSTKPVQARFNLKHLIRFCKASSLCNTLEMYMKQYPYPLILRYNVAGLGELNFALCPEQDDFDTDFE